ncbi:MAG: hypothetical protein WCP30_14500, partial [Mycobacteriaceae bacterium]
MSSATSTVSWQLVHAEPGALVYAAPGVAPSANPRVHRAVGQPSGWLPSGSLDVEAEPNPDVFEHPVLHYAGYIGRVGLLAAALGVGAAVARPMGTAWARSGGSDSTTSSSSESAGDESAPAAGPSVRKPASGTTSTPPGATVRKGSRGDAASGSTQPGNTVPTASPGRHASPSLPPDNGDAVAPRASASRLSRALSPTPTPLPTASPAEEPATTPPTVVATAAADGITTVNTPSAAPTPVASTPGAVNRIVAAALPVTSTSAPVTQAAEATQTPVLYGLFTWVRRTFGSKTPTVAAGNTRVDTPHNSAPVPGKPAYSLGTVEHTTGTVPGQSNVTDPDQDTLN